MKNIISEFKEFAVKGNALDLAIGVVIGAAFGKIVESIVNDIITPLIGMIWGSHDFSGILWGPLHIGSFINTVVDFLIVAGTIFVVVRQINRMKKADKKDEQKGASVEA